MGQGLDALVEACKMKSYSWVGRREYLVMMESRRSIQGLGGRREQLYMLWYWKYSEGLPFGTILLREQ